MSDFPATPIAQAPLNRGIAWLIAALLPLFFGPLWVSALAHRVPGRVGTFTGFVLVAVLLTCAFTDWSARKIPNWATYTAFLWALAVNGVWSYRVAVDGNSEDAHLEALRSWLGAIGLEQAVLGAAACFMVMLFVFSIARGGAGDVKLATAIGALLGLRDGLLAIAFSYILAGIVLLSWCTLTRGPLAFFRAFGKQFGSIFLPLWVLPPTEEEWALLRKPVPLGAFFAVGSIPLLLDIPLP